MRTPNSLQVGDIVDIISPANYIHKEELDKTVKIIENWGLNARISKHCLEKYQRYSGSLEHRIDDFKTALKAPDSKAILCSCGGYGCVQLLEHIDNDVTKSPKWLIGFSDISSLHALYQSKGIKSIHASMCRDINIPPTNKPCNEYLRQILLGENIQYTFPTDPNNVEGSIQGRLIGGNLSVLSELIATPYDIFKTGNILFLEDINESLYKIERMLYNLKYAGILNSLRGLIIGKFVNCTNGGRFSNLEELVLNFFPKRDIPICFNAPIGHISDNYPLIVGNEVDFKVEEKKVSLTFK